MSDIAKQRMPLIQMSARSLLIQDRELGDDDYVSDEDKQAIGKAAAMRRLEDRVSPLA